MCTVMRSSAKQEVEAIVVQTMGKELGPHEMMILRGAGKQLPPQGSVRWLREIHPELQAECNVPKSKSNKHAQRDTAMSPAKTTGA